MANFPSQQSLKQDFFKLALQNVLLNERKEAEGEAEKVFLDPVLVPTSFFTFWRY